MTAAPVSTHDQWHVVFLTCREEGEGTQIGPCLVGKRLSERGGRSGRLSVLRNWQEGRLGFGFRVVSGQTSLVSAECPPEGS